MLLNSETVCSTHIVVLFFSALLVLNLKKKKTLEHFYGKRLHRVAGHKLSRRLGKYNVHYIVTSCCCCR
jgi:hypothetical protein